MLPASSITNFSPSSIVSNAHQYSKEKAGRACAQVASSSHEPQSAANLSAFASYKQHLCNRHFPLFQEKISQQCRLMNDWVSAGIQAYCKFYFKDETSPKGWAELVATYKASYGSAEQTSASLGACLFTRALTADRRIDPCRWRHSEEFPVFFRFQTD